ncbi:MAG: hypothetical protein WC910_05250 [Bacteroidales bacterium]
MMLIIRLVREIGAMCEFMFRWGVKDAVEMFDPVISMEFAKKEDAYNELSLLPPEYGPMSTKIYTDLLFLKSRMDMKLKYLSYFLGRYGTEMAIKKGICYICNFYYRKGVEFGSGISKGDGIRIYRDVGTGRKHPYLYDGKGTHDNFLLCVKSECSLIENLRVSAGLKPVMMPLANLIAKAVMVSNERKEDAAMKKLNQELKDKTGLTDEDLNEEV